MSTPLLRISARIVAPLQFALALYFLLRGHNEPGGGFIGGLVAASSVLLYGLGFGFREVESRMPVPWFHLVLAGLAVSTLSGLLSVSLGLPFLTGLWGPELYLPLIGTLKLGSVFLFDVGVFVLVMGFGIGLALSFTDEQVQE